MANSTNSTVEVRILDKEYLVACPEDAREALEKAARHLDRKMREIRTSGKVYGTERIAVMAALNVTHELLKKNTLPEGSSEMLQQIAGKIDNALNVKESNEPR